MPTDTIQHMKEIRYCGKRVVVYCDGKCNKAWGVQIRPSVQFDPNDPDDYAFLADDELTDAPEDPGTYEGGHGKEPHSMNKWCVRQCERSCKVDAHSNKRLEIRDFAQRRYNQPWKHQG